MRSPTPNGAVFLSYASQDAAAARRLCEALRAAGIEVWFDQSELRGGDAWDQKIRRQIKDCTLFMPVVSANTQSRREGYFRLEWKLAEDRTHLMAKGTPFLVPVCIDDTKDWDALVPDSFMSVQWTRAAGGEAPPQFVERVHQLLSGGTTPPMGVPTRPAGPPRSESSASAGPRGADRAGRGRFRTAAWVGAGVLIVAVVVAGFVWRRAGEPARSVASNQRAAPEAPTAAVFPRDRDLQRACKLVYSNNAIAEDFALAEDIVKPLFATRPNDPEVVTVYAGIAQEYLTRGFDQSDARRALVQKLTERAVQLAPDSPDALAALGRYLVYLGAQLARAEEVTRHAIAINPDEPRYYRTLLEIVGRSKSAAELDELQARMAARFPRDPLIAYDIARQYKDRDNLALAEEWFDKTLALAPLSYAMVWKAWFLLETHGDVEGMNAMLARVPERERMATRVVYAYAVHATITGQTTTARRLLESLADTWLTDFDFTGPKALLLGDVLHVEGRDELAKLQYESAIAEIQRAEARNPTDLRSHRAAMWTHLALGHKEEARAALRLAIQALPRPYRWSVRFSWWSGAIRAALLLDERDQAIALLREAAAEPTGRLLLRNLFHVDPRMAPWRDDKEIAALLADPKPEKAVSSKPVTEAAKLTASAVALYTKLNYTREDLAVAADLARKATELEPDSAAAWGARAGVEATYVYRNWDPSEKRRQQTQTFVSRAVGLDPDEPEALLALGHLLTRQGVVPQAEAALRRALATRPEENRIARALAMLLSTTDRREEERVLLRDVLKRDPRDPLVHYDLAMSYANYGIGGVMSADVATAIAELDAGIAAKPIGSLLVLKAALTAGWQGDLATMRTTLDQLEKLPLAERAEDRAVYVAMWGGLLEHDADRVVQAATLTAKNYLEDTVLPRRPKDWSLALAHRLAGKENLARLDWQRSEPVSRARLRDDPNNQFTVLEIACTLAWLGRADEAAHEVEPIEAAWREELTPPRARMLAQYYAALGDAANTARYLQQGIDTSAFLTRKTVPLDPWFSKVRGRPEFEAVLQEPAGKKSAQ